MFLNTTSINRNIYRFKWRLTFKSSRFSFICKFCNALIRHQATIIFVICAINLLTRERSEFYGSRARREKFLKWHTELKENNYVFDFHELFRDITNFDPFAKCLTIASGYNLVYRANFVQENTIAIIPARGYRPKDRRSLLALKWLSYKAKKEDIFIRHACNKGEKRVASYLLDGYHEYTNICFEMFLAS